MQVRYLILISSAGASANQQTADIVICRFAEVLLFKNDLALLKYDKVPAFFLLHQTTYPA